MNFIPLLGRICFTAIFLMSSLGHFTPTVIQFAAESGVPYASFLVPLSGAIALIGGLSVLIGYKAKLGAWLLVLFLVPVTFTMHKFWGLSDPMTSLLQQGMFFKNISMLGGAFFIAYFGAGPYSIDNRKTT